jgi:hypothetical protein
MYPIPNGFRDRAISLYDSKIVEKKEMLRTVLNPGIYCSSDKVGAVCLLYVGVMVLAFPISYFPI